MTGPLQGVRVVELAVWFAGPAIGGILSDWGADVIKIEPLMGDPLRGLSYICLLYTSPSPRDRG